MSAIVSIIIPVYNAESYLEECLNSVTSQTYKNLEVIIINDGSTDNSETVIRANIGNDPRFHYFTQDNHGLGYTRNRGIKLSKGKYIFFLDSDDIIPTNGIKSLVKSIESADADYVVGKVIRFNKSRKYVPIRHLEFNLYKISISTNLLESPELLQDSIACNKLWSKSFLVNNRLAFQEGQYYEDLTLTTKAPVLAKKIEVINKVVYEWRVREDENRPSITQQQMKLDNTIDRLRTLAHNRKWLIENQVDLKIIEEHDLKSLLDVLRLHVSKYALVNIEEREQWLNSILSFIKEIPSAVSKRLPKKEYQLYTLLLSHEYSDLMKFSKVFSNIENTPIVIQDENRFILKGSKIEYDITQYLKPIIVIDSIKLEDMIWKLEGTLKTPKASYETEGKFYGLHRETKKKSYEFIKFKWQQSDTKSCYDFENRRFVVEFNYRNYLGNINAGVYDFYYSLEGFESYQTARVRLQKNEKVADIVERGMRFSLYRTNYGNLSMKVSRNRPVNRLLRKIYSYFK